MLMQMANLHLVEEAELSLTTGDYQQAVIRYLQIAAECPSSRAKIKEQLLIALSHVIDRLNLSRHLHCTREVGETSSTNISSHGLTSDQLLFSQISESMCSTFAGEADAMTMLGVKCLDEGVYNQAEFFLRVALEADSDYLGAKENLRVLFDRMVNRWHFHMLNDVQRNSAYFRAIHRVVKSIPNCSVLDIGSGTGILRYSRVCVCPISVSTTISALASYQGVRGGRRECLSTRLHLHPYYYPFILNFLLTFKVSSVYIIL